MDYRREIDGLRALAVLPVILFHAGFETFSGGFVGVDIFFVISGYLITTIILTELEQGKFSIANFYERRARRILPALFLVMLVCIPFAWVLLSPYELVSFSKSVTAVPLFISNFFFWRDGGYFETAAELKPLLHTWSLAVEEQYYIFFPIFLALCWRYGKKFIFWAVVVTAIFSLALAQVGSSLRPVPNFFLLPTRAWELAIGALVALYVSQKEIVLVALNKQQILSVCGLVFILVSIFTFNSTTPFPSAYGLLPTVGAALLILFAQKDTWVGKLLSSSVFFSVGLISYSAYLWHQPVLAFARYAYPELGAVANLFIIVSIIALSIASWKYVETPFRVKNGFGCRFIFSISIIGSFFFIVFGVISSRTDFDRESTMARELVNSPAIYASNMNERKFIRSRIEYESSAASIIILGSSRTMQIGTHIANNEVLNFGVSGASVEDDVAIWHLASKKFNPKSVLVSGDPWLFNANSGQNRWRTLEFEYNSALRDIGVETQLFNNSVSTNFVGNTYLAKLYNAINLSKIKADDDSPSVLDKKRKDGSHVYNISYANKSRSEVEHGASKFLSYAMSNYSFSKEYQDLFEKFILSISNNREVVLVLSPYHSKLYHLMQSQDRKFLDIENIFKDISVRLGVKLIGSYDPSKVGCDDSEVAVQPPLLG